MDSKQDPPPYPGVGGGGYPPYPAQSAAPGYPPYPPSGGPGVGYPPQPAGYAPPPPGGYQQQQVLMESLPVKPIFIPWFFTFSDTRYSEYFQLSVSVVQSYNLHFVCTYFH